MSSNNLIFPCYTHFLTFNKPWANQAFLMHWAYPFIEHIWNFDDLIFTIITTSLSYLTIRKLTELLKMDSIKICHVCRRLGSLVLTPTSQSHHDQNLLAECLHSRHGCHTCLPSIDTGSWKITTLFCKSSFWA